MVLLTFIKGRGSGINITIAKYFGNRPTAQVHENTLTNCTTTCPYENKYTGGKDFLKQLYT